MSVSGETSGDYVVERRRGHWTIAHDGARWGWFFDRDEALGVALRQARDRPGRAWVMIREPGGELRRIRI